MASLRDIAIRLMRKGIDIPTVSEVLEIDPAVLQEMRTDLNIDIKTDDVVEAMNRLAWASYEKGMRILQEGTPAMQMALIRIMFSMMRNLAGSQSPKVMADLVSQFRDSIEVHDDDDDYDDDATDDIEEDEPDEEA